MKIIFDLDGTLICSKKRLYDLFCFLAGDDKLSFSAYWDLKFAGHTNKEILVKVFGFSNIKVQVFVEDWMRLIETEQYLELDKIIEGIPKSLLDLKKEHKLYLCTARQSMAMLTVQLNKLSIADYFEQIFITEQRVSKEQLLRGSGLDFAREDWVVGDTGHDILAGKALGLRTCAVLSGFMNEPSLKAYSPDIILSDATGFRG